jgi:hypothetical protein
MSFLRRSCQYTAVLVAVLCCKPADAEQKVSADAQHKVSLSSLTENGFEIKATISLTGVTMILVQKEKEVFACNIFQAKDGSYSSACFPVR